MGVYRFGSVPLQNRGIIFGTEDRPEETWNRLGRFLGFSVRTEESNIKSVLDRKN
ncbi:hypothetical protein CCACVL1_29066 [Corchorus capsularis]|uniref:Uncharacterized protein n=1 Tax=Corchorus capsularis TaxID=210143 RepID=A0A1R3G430_COCAP|nr:hypothetical protein CCACVL1_29066 [Corchorus capsularis]